MEKIKKYIDRFFKNHKKNSKYGIYLDEVFSCAKATEKYGPSVIITTFDYGYAKGYRVAMADMKKGGVA